MSTLPIVEMLKIVNDKQEIDRAISSFETFAARHNLPESLCYDFKLAIDELVTNVIDHGYEADDGKQAIELQWGVSSTEVFMKCTDSAAAFDPTTVHKPPPSERERDDFIGGLGLYFVRKTMDRMEYHRKGNSQTLTLAKEFPKREE